MQNAKCQMLNAKWATTGIYRFTNEKPGAEKIMVRMTRSWTIAA
jgi:hypothetical protein